MAKCNLHKMAIIGGGALGQALCGGLLRAGVFNKDEVIICDIDAAKLQLLRDEHGVNTTTDTLEAATSGDSILLVVKPYVVDSVLEQIGPKLTSDQLLISCAAGVTIERLESKLPKGIPVVRAMPNTPCLLGLGATGFGLGSSANGEHADIAKCVFGAVGQAVQVPEKLLDAVTGLSGSGPAYIYLMIEALADAGVSEGLPRDAALMLAAQTTIGAAKMVLETGKHPAQLKDMITTPGGTTIAGLAVMERQRFRATIIDAVQAAAKRSHELSHPEKKSG